MAILQFSDGRLATDWCDIQAFLDALNIQIKPCKSEAILLLKSVLNRDVLSEFERQQILTRHNHGFKFLKQEEDYLWSSILTLHPGSPELYPLLTSAGEYHTHTDPEALSVLTGEAIFGFIGFDGEPFQLLLQPQEYLYIPAGVEHSFSLSASLSLKAVRYFKTGAGWMPRYTQRQAEN